MPEGFGVKGSQNVPLQQVPVTLELITQDTRLKSALITTRLIDYLLDNGEYSAGTIVKLTDEGLAVPSAFGATVGDFSGYALKVTVPAGGSTTVFVGISPLFKGGTVFQLESAFYLQAGLNAVVNWGIGSSVNRTEESTIFRVSYEGNNNWNEYLRTLVQEFFQTHNWVVFALTNISANPQSLYVGRAFFNELPAGFKYSDDNFSGYIPVTEAGYTVKVTGIGAYAGWVGYTEPHLGFTVALNVQSDGVNNLDSRVRVSRTGGAQPSIIHFIYNGAAQSSTQFVDAMIDNRCKRGTAFDIACLIAGGGKGYIRRIRVQLYPDNQGLPSQELYLGGSAVTDNDNDTDTFTLLDYSTDPLPCQYAEVDHIELSVAGTACTVCHINVNGVQASENVALGASIILTDLKQVEKLELLVNDAATGATTVAYKVYYKRIDALLWQNS